MLYIVGGYYLDLLQIYNTSSNEWSQGPNMNVPRWEHGCVISSVTNTLYAIAGGASGDIYYNTVEYISTNDLIHGNIQRII